jgi:DNA-binding HxlR family transcriptional regulator
VVCNRLKLMCDEQLLERVPDPERPGRRDNGRQLAPALLVLMKWGDR